MELNQPNQTFEQRLEGWKYRMAFIRTIARVVAVTIQIIIALLLLNK
jgi:hypothetical protein